MQGFRQFLEKPGGSDPRAGVGVVTQTTWAEQNAGLSWKQPRRRFWRLSSFLEDCVLLPGAPSVSASLFLGDPRSAPRFCVVGES